MQHCDYCGKESDDVAQVCPGCGTPLPSQPDTTNDAIPPIINPPELTGARATIILLLSFVAQFIGAAMLTVVLMIIAYGKGLDLQDREQVSQFKRQSQPAAILAAAVFSLFATLVAPVVLVRRDLSNRTPTGAAWAIGTTKDIANGLALGVVVAIAALVVMAPFAKVTNIKPGPLTTMALTPGFSRIAWVCVAILLVPVPEELLFRGVMYGGYRQSFGASKAALLTTSIFVLMHITEWIHFLPSIIGIIALAISTLFMRLRSSAIGPAIGVHLAYNSTIVLSAILSTALVKS